MYFWLILIAAFSLLFGTLGLIASVVTIGFYLILKYRILHFKNKRFKGLSKETKRENQMLNLKELVDKEASENFDVSKLKSYKQILYYGSEKEKINLIGMVIYNPSSEFVNLIKIALDDNNETVRILASTSLQKMEAFYEEKIKNLEKKALNDAEPNSSLRKLVKTYDRFIDSSLIDASLKPIYINKMFNELKKIDDINISEKTLLLYIKTCIKYGKLEIIDKVMEELENYKKLDNTYKFLFIEYYFKKLQFDKLYKMLKTIDINSLKNENEIEAYKYWINNAS